MSDKLVTLKENGERNFSVLHSDRKVGFISLSLKDQTAEVYFEIDKPYRKKHYASSALYEFDSFAHEKYDVNIIHAVIDRDNDQAKHVLEHNGYAIVSKDADHVYYAHQKAVTRNDDHYDPQGEKVLYFAGGCFWGTERVFKVLDGVTDTTVGYANGHIENPTYEEVCRNETGFRETVRVTYDPSVVSTDTVLDAYFLCVDPTQVNGQGNDHGTQYQTGVYYRDKSLLPVIERKFSEEREKYDEFHVELKPLECFYEAEEYHQDYLTKNPDGYCHITLVDLEKVKKLNHRA